jgi:manganese efflux pump family protein
MMPVDMTSQFIGAVLLALALSIDSFAVSMGAFPINFQRNKLKEFYFFRTALAFAVIQCLLFVVGFLLGKSSSKFFSEIDHWISSFILFYLAIKTWQSRGEAIWSSNASEKRDFGFALATTALSAIATSIDAFGAGTGVALSNQNLILHSVAIFLITGFAVWAALHLGRKMSTRFQRKLPVLSALVLSFLGFKILYEHLLR